MLENKKVLAVVPARAGSKRCPRKNVLPYKRKPLVLWAVEVALDCRVIDKVVVSTDDPEVVELVTRMTKATVIDRPAELATDTATNEDVLRHALSLYPEFHWVILLQPTSPLRNSRDIDRTLREARHGGFDAACTYSESGKKNGAVYACTAEWLRSGKDFTNYYADPYFMDEARSLDINLPEDFNG